MLYILTILYMLPSINVFEELFEFLPLLQAVDEWFHVDGRAAVGYQLIVDDTSVPPGLHLVDGLVRHPLAVYHRRTVDVQRHGLPLGRGLHADLRPDGHLRGHGLAVAVLRQIGAEIRPRGRARYLTRYVEECSFIFIAAAVLELDVPLRPVLEASDQQKRALAESAVVASLLGARVQPRPQGFPIPILFLLLLLRSLRKVRSLEGFTVYAQWRPIPVVDNAAIDRSPFLVGPINARLFLLRFRRLGERRSDLFYLGLLQSLDFVLLLLNFVVPSAVGELRKVFLARRGIVLIARDLEGQLWIVERRRRRRRFVSSLHDQGGQIPFARSHFQLLRLARQTAGDLEHRSGVARFRYLAIARAEREERQEERERDSLK